MLPTTLSDFASSGVLVEKFGKKLTENTSELFNAENIKNKVFENPEIKSFIGMLPSKDQVQNYIPTLEDTAGEYIDKGKNAATTILNKVNNIGGQKDQIKQLESAKARDNDSTFRKVIRNSVVAV